MCNLVAITSNFQIQAGDTMKPWENLTREEIEVIIENTGLEVFQVGESCMLRDLMADTIAYLLSYEYNRSETIEYNQPFEIDHCRLLCLLFLIDWRTALLDTDSHETLTRGTWCRGLQGPYVRNILEMVRGVSSMIEIFQYDFAAPVKLYFFAKRDGGVEKSDGGNVEALEPLTDDQKRTIRHTVDSFRDVEMDRLIELVYATDPLIDAEMHEPINVVEFAARHVRLYGQLKV